MRTRGMVTVVAAVLALTAVSGCGDDEGGGGSTGPAAEATGSPPAAGDGSWTPGRKAL